MPPHLEPFDNDQVNDSIGPPVQRPGALIDLATGLPRFPQLANPGAGGASSGIGNDDDADAAHDAALISLGTRMTAVEQLLPDDDTQLEQNIAANLSALQQNALAITALQEIIGRQVIYSGCADQGLVHNTATSAYVVSSFIATDVTQDVQLAGTVNNGNGGLLVTSDISFINASIGDYLVQSQTGQITNDVNTVLYTPANQRINTSVEERDVTIPDLVVGTEYFLVLFAGGGSSVNAEMTVTLYGTEDPSLEDVAKRTFKILQAAMYDDTGVQDAITALQNEQTTQDDALAAFILLVNNAQSAQDQALSNLAARADETDTEQTAQNQAISNLESRADETDTEQSAQDQAIANLVTRADETDTEQSAQDQSIANLVTRADETDTEQAVQDDRLEKIEAQQCDVLNLFPNGGRDLDIAYPFAETAAISYNPAENSPTVKGVIEITGTGNLTASGANYYVGEPIKLNSLDPYTQYIQTVEARLKSSANNTGVDFYTGWQFFDKNGTVVQWYHSQYRPETVTVLAAPLAVGDTEIVVETQPGFIVANTAYAVLADWVDDAGYDWGNRGYSREVNVGVACTAVTDNGDGTTTLTYASGWAGAPGVVGQAFRQASSSNGSFRYISWVNAPLSDEWKTNADGDDNILKASTEFSQVGLTNWGDGRAVLSGAVWMLPIILARPDDLTAEYVIQIGRFELKALVTDPTKRRTYAMAMPQRRQYFSEGAATDEGLNLVYGSSNQNASSNYSKTAPDRRAPGVGAPADGVLLEWILQFIKGDTNNWGGTVRMWKQTKQLNSIVSVNVLLDTVSVPAQTGTNNQLVQFIGRYPVLKNDVIFFTFQKDGTAGNNTTYWYTKSENYLFEGGPL